VTSTYHDVFLGNLQTYAAFMRCFGFGLLNYKMWSSKSSKGVSMKTMQIYILVFVFRLISILRHQGYLPFDKSGDWFYHFVEFLSLASTASALYATMMLFRNTYDEMYDRFGNLHIPSDFGAAYLVVPCLLVAIVFHP
jgi:ER lumen protein retaining receptor